MALSGVSNTTFEENLKRFYAPGQVRQIAFGAHPLLEMIPKETNAGGTHVAQKVFYAGAQSRSAQFNTAKTLSTSKSVQGAEFRVPYTRDYAIGTLDGLFVESMKGDKFAAWTQLTDFTNSYMMGVADSLSLALYGNGWGTRGQVNSSWNGTDLTFGLQNRSDAVKFEVDMEIQFADLEASGLLKANGGSATITRVDRTNSTTQITINAVPSGGVAPAAGDFLFAKGDREDAASPTRKFFAGLNGWIPAPGADVSASFNNVVRNVDRERLAGAAYDGSSQDVDEALRDGIMELVRAGCPPSDDMRTFLNPVQFNDLTKSLDSNGTKYDQVEIASKMSGKLPINFSGVRMMTPLGKVDVFPDKACPNAEAYVLKMSTWKFYSLGAAPRLLEHGSGRILQDEADGVALRVGYYGCLVSSIPAWNCHVQLRAIA